MSGRAGIALVLGLLGCGAVTPAAVDADPPVDGQTLEAAAPAADAAYEATASEVSGTPDAATFQSCATAPPPLVGVDEAQCASDCHSAVCSMGGVRFVGCKRATTTAGTPAQFYCGADFVTPTCVANCP